MKTPERSWTRKDFKIEWFSGKGAGGQHRNKHQNCCRVTHIESGLVATGQSHRERKRNFEEAFTRLGKKIEEVYARESVRVRFPGNTETIRTYNIPDNRVKDHASGHTTLYDVDFLDEMIKARKYGTDN